MVIPVFRQGHINSHQTFPPFYIPNIGILCALVDRNRRVTPTEQPTSKRKAQTVTSG